MSQRIIIDWKSMYHFHTYVFYNIFINMYLLIYIFHNVFIYKTKLDNIISCIYIFNMYDNKTLTYL